jgi:preprotein translocase subunit SecD
VSTSQLWQPVVVIQFDDTGKDIFCNLTEAIVGKPMAIFIGGQLVTAPVIREKICGGSAQIDGWFTPQSAKALTDELNTWALPAPLILAQEEKLLHYYESRYFRAQCELRWLVL